MSKSFRTALAILAALVVACVVWIGGTAYVNRVASEARAEGVERGVQIGLNRGVRYCRVGIAAGLHEIPHYRTLENDGQGEEL